MAYLPKLHKFLPSGTSGTNNTRRVIGGVTLRTCSSSGHQGQQQSGCARSHVGTALTTGVLALAAACLYTSPTTTKTTLLNQEILTKLHPLSLCDIIYDSFHRLSVAMDTTVWGGSVCV